MGDKVVSVDAWKDGLLMLGFDEAIISRTSLPRCAMGTMHLSRLSLCGIIRSPLAYVVGHCGAGHTLGEEEK
jgi:hypothetical protein